MRTEAIVATGANGCLLRVEFVHQGDRFGHVIFAVSATGEAERLLESIEDTGRDNWPASPPLQSLSLEALPDGRPVALLVGMAGGSHWSASVEPLADRPALLFDVACRHTRLPQWLGSRYRQLPGQEKRVAIDGEVAVTREQGMLAIQPTSPPSGAGTARWRYIARLNHEP